LLQALAKQLGLPLGGKGLAEIIDVAEKLF
jgi:hypothetical protein